MGHTVDHTFIVGRALWSAQSDDDVMFHTHGIMAWPQTDGGYLSQADIMALRLDPSRLFIFLLYERNTALLRFRISAMPKVKPGRKGGPPPIRRCSPRPTWMPARLIVASSDSLDSSDSSDS